MALIDTYRNNVTKKRDEIAKLTADKAKEKDKITKAEVCPNHIHMLLEILLKTTISSSWDISKKVV